MPTRLAMPATVPQLLQPWPPPHFGKLHQMLAALPMVTIAPSYASYALHKFKTQGPPGGAIANVKISRM
jgi:hypothetical protein